MRDVSAYMVDGSRVHSVTEILGAANIESYVGVAQDVLEAKAILGQRVDAYCSYLDTGLKLNKPPDAEALPYVEAYLLFCRENRFRLRWTDKVVISKAYRYAGTLDCAGYLRASDKPDDLFVIDRKCVVTVTAATALQTAGYAIALAEQENTKVKRRAALQLKPDGTYKLKQFHRDNDRADFLACNRVAHWKVNNKLTTPGE